MEKENGSGSALVVVATLDEEKGIGPTLAELRRVLNEPRFLVIDGNSADRTARIAKEMGAEVLLQKGTGKGDAIAQAIREIDHNVKYLIFIDADFTYPAEYIPNMIQILDENPDVGMVTGNRFNHTHELTYMADPFFLGNRFLAFAQRLLNGVHLQDPLTGLRVVRWKTLKHWQPKSRGFDIEAEINHRVERMRYSTVEIPIHYRSRIGKKKLKFRHGVTILRRILSESMKLS